MPPPPHHTNFTTLQKKIFDSFLQVKSPSNLAILLIFKRAFSSAVDRFFLTCPCHKLKKLWKGPLYRGSVSNEFFPTIKQTNKALVKLSCIMHLPLSHQFL